VRRLMEEPTHMEARNGGDQYSHGCNIDDPLVSRRVATRAEREQDQRPKDHHIGHWGDIEKIGVHTRRCCTTKQPVGGGYPSHDDHHTSQHKTEYPQFSMNIHRPAHAREFCARSNTIQQENIAPWTWMIRLGSGALKTPAK